MLIALWNLWRFPGFEFLEAVRKFAVVNQEFGEVKPAHFFTACKYDLVEGAVDEGHGFGPIIRGELEAHVYKTAIFER